MTSADSMQPYVVVKLTSNIANSKVLQETLIQLDTNFLYLSVNLRKNRSKTSFSDKNDQLGEHCKLNYTNLQWSFFKRRLKQLGTIIFIDPVIL